MVAKRGPLVTSPIEPHDSSASPRWRALKAVATSAVCTDVGNDVKLTLSPILPSKLSPPELMAVAKRPTAWEAGKLSTTRPDLATALIGLALDMKLALPGWSIAQLFISYTLYA